MRDAEEVRDELAALKPHLQAEYPIDELGIFGSYAREEQRSDSDLDVVVSFERPVTLFDLVRLEDELTRRLNVEVDLITRDSLKPQVETRVADDIVYV